MVEVFQKSQGSGAVFIWSLNLNTTKTSYIADEGPRAAEHGAKCVVMINYWKIILVVDGG